METFLVGALSTMFATIATPTILERRLSGKALEVQNLPLLAIGSITGGVGAFLAVRLVRFLRGRG